MIMMMMIIIIIIITVWSLGTSGYALSLPSFVMLMGQTVYYILGLRSFSQTLFCTHQESYYESQISLSVGTTANQNHPGHFLDSFYSMNWISHPNSLPSISSSMLCKHTYVYIQSSKVFKVNWIGWWCHPTQLTMWSEIRVLLLDKVYMYKDRSRWVSNEAVGWRSFIRVCKSNPFYSV
jgi:hypothetical protein